MTGNNEGWGRHGRKNNIMGGTGLQQGGEGAEMSTLLNKEYFK